MIIMFDRVQFAAIVVIVAVVGCAPVPLPKLTVESEYVPTDKAGLTDKVENYQQAADKSSVIALDSKSLGAAMDIQSAAAGGSGAVVKSAVAAVVKEEQAKPAENLTPIQRVKKGIAFLKTGDVVGAKKEFFIVLDRQPENTTAKMMLRQIELTPAEYFQGYDIDDPRPYLAKPGDTFSTLAAQYLKSALEFHILAKFNNYKNSERLVLGQKIKIPLAEQDKDAVVAAGPADNRIEYTLAEKYYNEGRYESAIAVLEPRIQSHSKDFKSIDLLVLIYTKFANLLVNKANLLEAKSVLEKAVSIQPGNKRLKKQLAFVEKQRQAERHYQKGLKELKRGNKNKAFDAFNNALLLKPNHGMAKQQIVKMKSNVVKSLHHKAMRLYKDQELELAIVNWTKVLKINPAHELARLYRGRAVELKERLDSLPAQ